MKNNNMNEGRTRRTGSRIDYGTGHEKTFVMFVAALFKIQFLQGNKLLKLLYSKRSQMENQTKILYVTLHLLTYWAFLTFVSS